MKLIKIVLPIALLGFIGFFIYKSCADITPPPPPPLPKNQNVIRIDSFIDLLNKKVVSSFSKDIYREINYYIENDHKFHFFSKNDNENDQWKSILSQNLYSAYAPKLVEYAMFVFNGSEWRTDDLNTIRNEVNMLQRSSYLKEGSEVSEKFTDINSILEKYDEISGFIASCNNFVYTKYEVIDHFPDLSDMIQKSRVLLSNNLDNPYVNNCTRLKEELNEVPENLFNKHSDYLIKKIEKNWLLYRGLQTHADYVNQIYTPLLKHIYELNNNNGIYAIDETTFDEKIKFIKEFLGKNNDEAYEYFQ